MASSPSLRPSTPPLSSNLHTPTTPKHGWEDNYEPYSPRKSARVSSQRARAIHTPPQNLQAKPLSPTSVKKVASVTTPSHPFSPSSSGMGSRKKAPKTSLINNGRTASGGLTFDSTISSTATPGIPAPPGGKMELGRSTTTVNNNGMLPTPAKTPTQKPTVVAPGIRSIARNLFPIRGETAEDAMPSPKKKGHKQHSGCTLGSFGAEDGDIQIAIYTDSHDRVPEVDLSADNPFYGQSGAAAQPEPSKRSSKRRKIVIPGEGEQTIEEAERREDGLIYVFRGKKTFRKFNDTEEVVSGVVDDDAEIDAALEADLPSRLRRPLTRSSVKPRLLFPTPEQLRARETRSQATEDEEEAATDIEEPNHLSTPKGQMDDVVATPMAPKFAPASPPTTTRVTRSRQMDITGSPTQVERDRSLSPFHQSFSLGRDGPPTRGRKRGGEFLKRGDRGKKIRGE